MSTPLIQVPPRPPSPTSTPAASTRQCRARAHAGHWRLALALHSHMSRVHHHVNRVSTVVLIVALAVLVFHVREQPDDERVSAVKNERARPFVRLVHGPVVSAMDNRSLLAAHRDLLVAVARTDVDGVRLVDVCEMIDDLTLNREPSCRVESAVACFWDMTRVTGALRHALDDEENALNAFSHPCINVSEPLCASSRLSPPDRPCAIIDTMHGVDGSLALVNAAMQATAHFKDYSDTYWARNNLTSSECRALLSSLARILQRGNTTSVALDGVLASAMERVRAQAPIASTLAHGCSVADGITYPISSLVHPASSPTSFVSSVYLREGAETRAWMRGLVDTLDYDHSLVHLYSPDDWALPSPIGMRVGHASIAIYVFGSTVLLALFVDRSMSAMIVHMVAMSTAVAILVAIAHVLDRPYTPLLVLLYPYERMAQSSALTPLTTMFEHAMRVALVIALVVCTAMSFVEWSLICTVLVMAVVSVMCLIMRPAFVLGVNRRRPPVRCIKVEKISARLFHTFAMSSTSHRGFIGSRFVKAALTVSWMAGITAVTLLAVAHSPPMEMAEATMSSARYTGTPIYVHNCTREAIRAMTNETGSVSSVSVAADGAELHIDSCHMSCVHTYETLRRVAIEKECSIESMYDAVLAANQLVPFDRQLFAILISAVATCVAWRLLVGSTLASIFVALTAMGSSLLAICVLYIMRYAVVRVDDAIVIVLVPCVCTIETYMYLVALPTPLNVQPVLNLAPVLIRQSLHVLLILVSLAVSVVRMGTMPTGYATCVTTFVCHMMTMVLTLPLAADLLAPFVVWVRRAAPASQNQNSNAILHVN